MNSKVGEERKWRPPLKCFHLKVTVPALSHCLWLQTHPSVSANYSSPLPTGSVRLVNAGAGGPREGRKHLLLLCVLLPLRAIPPWPCTLPAALVPVSGVFVHKQKPHKQQAAAAPHRSDPSSCGSSSNSFGSDTLKIYSSQHKGWQLFPAVITSVTSVSPARFFSPLTLVETMPNVE